MELIAGHRHAGHAIIRSFPRQKAAGRPNALWVADFTYVSTGLRFRLCRLRHRCLFPADRWLDGIERRPDRLRAGASPLRTPAARFRRLENPRYSPTLRQLENDSKVYQQYPLRTCALSPLQMRFAPESNSPAVSTAPQTPSSNRMAIDGGRFP